MSAGSGFLNCFDTTDGRQVFQLNQFAKCFDIFGSIDMIATTSHGGIKILKTTQRSPVYTFSETNVRTSRWLPNSLLFSPDGHYLAYTHHHGIAVIDVQLSRHLKFISSMNCFLTSVIKSSGTFCWLVGGFYTSSWLTLASACSFTYLSPDNQRTTEITVAKRNPMLFTSTHDGRLLHIVSGGTQWKVFELATGNCLIQVQLESITAIVGD